MIVDDLDIVGRSIMPPKANPPLLVDPDAVLPAPLTLQSLEPVAWRHPQVSQSTRLVEHAQLAQRHRLDLKQQPPTAPTTPNLCGCGIGKALNHALRIAAPTL
jgi:hypothetical protein